jgi:hypothetical protein
LLSANPRDWRERAIHVDLDVNPPGIDELAAESLVWLRRRFPS